MTQQASLDGFLSAEDSAVAELEEETEAVGRVEDAAREEDDAGRCELCGEPDGPLSSKRLRLHAGALTLYLRGGRWAARADIDHVYHRCRKGLVENIRFLKRLYDYVCVRGSNGKVLGVGKAYDDDLYIYGVGRFPESFEGLRLRHIETETMDWFDRLHHYLDPVPEEVLREALGGEP